MVVQWAVCPDASVNAKALLTRHGKGPHLIPIIIFSLKDRAFSWKPAYRVRGLCDRNIAEARLYFCCLFSKSWGKRPVCDVETALLRILRKFAQLKITHICVEGRLPFVFLQLVVRLNVTFYLSIWCCIVVPWFAEQGLGNDRDLVVRGGLIEVSIMFRLKFELLLNVLPLFVLCGYFQSVGPRAEIDNRLVRKPVFSLFDKLCYIGPVEHDKEVVELTYKLYFDIGFFPDCLFAFHRSDKTD